MLLTVEIGGPLSPLSPTAFRANTPLNAPEIKRVSNPDEIPLDEAKSAARATRAYTSPPRTIICVPHPHEAAREPDYWGGAACSPQAIRVVKYLVALGGLRGACGLPGRRYRAQSTLIYHDEQGAASAGCSPSPWPAPVFGPLLEASH